MLVFNPFTADVSVGQLKGRGKPEAKYKGWESLYVGMESNLGNEFRTLVV